MAKHKVWASLNISPAKNEPTGPFAMSLLIYPPSSPTNAGFLCPLTLHNSLKEVLVTDDDFGVSIIVFLL